MVGAGIQVVPWRRYGKDRLYVNDAGGGTVGWLDNVTGQKEVRAGQEAIFEAAIARYRAGNQPKTILRPDPAPSTVGRLAHNVPGAALELQARKAWQEAPISSFLGRLFGIHTSERHWRVGLRGERIVAAELRRLDEGWRVLHSIPVGSRSADIDHVVIGPGGVFTLNTKHHPGGSVQVKGDAVFVNGQYYPYIRNLRHEARRASQLLSKACGFEVPVMGTLVIVGADRFKVRQEPDGRVSVVARRKLVRWLRRQPHRQNAQQIDRIYCAASSPETWTKTARE